jgi:CheY-like chemotaxis protein
MVDTYNDPRKALLDFEPNFYDLLLIDINMPVIYRKEFWKLISMSEFVSCQPER